MSARTPPMPAMWSRLVGQDVAVTLLRDAVASDAVGHAYLFVGPEGVGRELAAIALAASLNCPEGGCGSCSVCDKVLRRAHPDLHTVAPQGAQILVEQIREMRQAAHRSSMEGRVKLFLVEDAHRLNPAASNALLKVLEEPPADVVMVLVTSSPEDLLETIVSRCRRVDFKALSPDEVARILIEQHHADEQLAAWAARAAGDLSRALRFVKDPEAPSRRAAHLEIAGRLVRGGVAEAIRIATETTQEAKRAGELLAEKHKEELTRYVESFGDARGTAAARKRIEERHKREIRRRETEAYDSVLVDVASFYRDVLMLGSGAGDDVLVNLELRDRLDRAAAVADLAWLVLALDRIEAVRRSLARNVQPALALEALFMELATPRARRSA